MISIFCCCILWKFHKRNVKARYERENAPIEIIDVEKNPDAAASLIAQFGGDPEEVLSRTPKKNTAGEEEEMTPEDLELAAEEKRLEEELAEEEKKLAALERSYTEMESQHEQTMYKLTKNFLGRLSTDPAQREKAKKDAIEAGGRPSKLSALASSGILKLAKEAQEKERMGSVSEEPASSSKAQPPPYEEAYQSTTTLTPAADGGKDGAQPSERV